MSSLLSFIQPLAREAGALLMSHFGKVEYTYKGDVDLVTVADKQAEALIVERIKKQFPDHGIMGEEGARANAGSEYVWYIDPLDGTTNFAHGYPVFCVSIGLEHKGKRVAGAIYDPTRDELFSAEAGHGAELDGKRIHVSKTDNLGEALVATGFPTKKRHKNPNIHFYHHITMRTHGIRRGGSAALDLAYVACGRYDAYWEFILNPWDTAAGVLLVEEAGGKVTGVYNTPFEIVSREVVATNGVLHPGLTKELQNVFENKSIDDLPDLRAVAFKESH